MTPLEAHEKYLAWIDGLLKVSKKHDAKLTFGNTSHPDWASTETNSLTANRKVLERHAPSEKKIRVAKNGKIVEAIICDCGVGTFPCPTYTDITDGLGIPNE